MDFESDTRQAQGGSELALSAPLRPGLIDAPERCGYEARLEATLHALRGMQQGAAAGGAAAITSPIDRAPKQPCVEWLLSSGPSEHAVRSLVLAIGGPPQRRLLLLRLRFDRPWEACLRSVWRELGALLDLVGCNCEGYVSAFEHGVESYADWLRHARLVGTTEDSMLAGARQARGAMPPSISPGADDGVMFRRGLHGLSLLHPLSQLYPPGSPDDGVLLRAAHALLPGLLEPQGAHALRALRRRAQDRLATQIDWFSRPVASRPALAERHREVMPDEIQGDVCALGERVTHGCLVLLAIGEPGAARHFLSRLHVTTPACVLKPGEAYLNVAFSERGLRRVGLPPSELDALQWPSVAHSGDPAGLRGARTAGGARALQADLVLQLHVRCDYPPPRDHEIVGNPAHPLFNNLSRLAAAAELAGLALLCVLPMKPWHRAITESPPPEALLLGHAPPGDDAPPLPAMWDNGSFLTLHKLRGASPWPRPLEAAAGPATAGEAGASPPSLSPVAVAAHRYMRYGSFAGENGLGPVTCAGERGLVVMAYSAQPGPLPTPLDVPAGLQPEWRLSLFVPAMKGLARLAAG